MLRGLSRATTEEMVGFDAVRLHTDQPSDVELTRNVLNCFQILRRRSF